MQLGNFVMGNVIFHIIETERETSIDIMLVVVIVVCSDYKLLEFLSLMPISRFTGIFKRHCQILHHTDKKGNLQKMTPFLWIKTHFSYQQFIVHQSSIPMLQHI